MPQLEIESVVAHSFAERSKAIDRYLVKNRDAYLGMAAMIQPDSRSWWLVWSRAAFAILSAKATFDQSVAALTYATRHMGTADAEGFTRYGMVPTKAGYLNSLPRGRAILA